MAKLTEQEFYVIKNTLRTLGTTQKDLAEKTEINPSQLSRMLKGYLDMPSEQGNKIYDILGKPRELDFLVSLGEFKRPFQRAEDHWKSLLYLKTYDLERIYFKQTPETRGKILGELERLTERYLKNKTSKE